MLLPSCYGFRLSFPGTDLPEISVNPCFYYFSSDDMHSDDMHTHKKNPVRPRVFQCFVHVGNHFDSVLTITKWFLASFDLWTFLLIWLFSSSSPNPWPKLFVLSPPGVLLSTAPTPEHFDGGWSTVVGLGHCTSLRSQCCSPPSASRNLRLGSESPGGCWHESIHGCVSVLSRKIINYNGEVLWNASIHVAVALQTLNGHHFC